MENQTEMFTEQDRQNAQMLSIQCSTDNNPNGECFVAAKRMAIHKNEAMRNHEQSLLWTLESILDDLCIDAEAYEIAMNEFKEHLINKFD